MKTLDAFEFDRSGVGRAAAHAGEGDYVAKAEPVLLVGEAGTERPIWPRDCASPRAASADGAVHHREGADQRAGQGGTCQPTSRALGRWERLDLICIDELGYVLLAETACELMFQVIADRAEKAAVIVTTNCLSPNGLR